MDRIKESFRLSYKTNWRLGRLVESCTKDLQKEISKVNSMIDNYIRNECGTIEKGRAFTFRYHVTTGSIIDMAINGAKDLTIDEWTELTNEEKRAHNNIEDVELKAVSPYVYLDPTTCDELANLQYKLRGDNPRVPKKAYIVRIAVYYAYKKAFPNEFNEMV